MERTQKPDTEKNEFGLPGIGIPAEILLHPYLSSTEKLLFGLIKNLSYTSKGCWATNKYLGNMLGVGKSSITNGVSNLQKYGFIQIEFFDHPDGRTGRRIYIFNGYVEIYRNMIQGGYEKIQRGVLKNSEGGLKKFVPPSEKIHSYIDKYILLDKDREDSSVENGFFGEISSEQDSIKPSHFTEFWNLYPRKKGSKGKAKEKWDALCRKKDRPSWKTIKEAIKAQMKSDQWQEDEQFIPYPTTWINQRRWLDDPEQLISHSKSKKSTKTAYREKGKKYKIDMTI